MWIVGIVNALNLMDNMDGLAAGVAAVASGSFLLLAILNGQILVASLGAALLGACLGFLFYNFQPAVTFMGDTGSMLLGFALAVLGIKLTFPTLPLAQSWMVPILVLGLPIFDTTLVLISRQRRGRPWWQGGTDHVSHRLARLGLSHRRVVVALYGVTAGLGLIAVLVTRTPLARACLAHDCWCCAAWNYVAVCDGAAACCSGQDHTSSRHARGSNCGGGRNCSHCQSCCFHRSLCVCHLHAGCD